MNVWIILLWNGGDVSKVHTFLQYREAEVAFDSRVGRYRMNECPKERLTHECEGTVRIASNGEETMQMIESQVIA